MFVALDGKTRDLGDDEQFGAVPALGKNLYGARHQVGAALDVPHERAQIIADLPDGAADGWRVECSPGLGVRWVAGSCRQQWLCLVTPGKTAGGHRFSDTGRAEADADAAVFSQGAGELDEPAMLFGAMNVPLRYPVVVRHLPDRCGAWAHDAGGQNPVLSRDHVSVSVRIWGTRLTRSLICRRSTRRWSARAVRMSFSVTVSWACSGLMARHRKRYL